jgi:hypothetical protein
MKNTIKSFVFTAAFLLCGNVLFAQAPGCNSAAEIVSESWDKFSSKLQMFLEINSFHLQQNQ